MQPSRSTQWLLVARAFPLISLVSIVTMSSVVVIFLCVKRQQRAKKQSLPLFSQSTERKVVSGTYFSEQYNTNRVDAPALWQMEDTFLTT